MAKAKGEEPSEGYGGRGRPWHPDFIEYMKRMVADPAYAGMPDVYYEGDRIQWEAPSNRLSGAFKDTYTKRKAWWQRKALEVGIDPETSQWISRVAKRIHPTKQKPCKICGRVLSIRYAYPNGKLFRRLAKLPYTPADYPLDPLEHIADLVKRLVNDLGDRVLDDLSVVLSVKGVSPPLGLGRSLDRWLTWVNEEYIPAEPSLLSPGAMSNPPDRFDGFHCDNLCCRGTHDKGRHKENLATYVTDRRVFEYWSGGDWIAADRLMGLVRVANDVPCRHGHPGPCSADHIGPISLGFAHRPQFLYLCKPCNSAKNNRMTLADVQLLLAAELKGEAVISWHSRVVWDLLKGRVSNNETALRLSKVLRDARHSLMAVLQKVASARHYLFLASLLDLGFADFDVEFINLRVEDHLTVFDVVKKTKRTTSQVAKQKGRRCRVAFQELSKYFERTNRNALVVETDDSIKSLDQCLAELATFKPATEGIDEGIELATRLEDAGAMDAAFQRLADQITSFSTTAFTTARAHLEKGMESVGRELASRWDDERYVRPSADDLEPSAEEEAEREDPEDPENDSEDGEDS